MKSKFRYCIVCKTEKDVSEFGIRNKARGWLRSDCKECVSKYQSIYRAEHAKEKKTYAQKWYQKNKKNPEIPTMDRRVRYQKGDHVGGYLFYIEEAGKPNNVRMIKVRCEYLNCGKIFITRMTAIRYGHSQTCGCLRAEASFRNHKPKGQSGLNQAYRSHKGGAKSHGCEPLPKEIWLELSQQNCFWGNCPPSNISVTTGGTTKQGKEWSKFIYNGIDRVDSNKGYELDNCVPCCFTHNGMKSDLTKEDFLIAIKKVYEKFQLNEVSEEDIKNRKLEQPI
jgi:hypothetical protein